MFVKLIWSGNDFDRSRKGNLPGRCHVAGDHDVTTSQGKEKGGLPVVAGMGHFHGEGHGGLN